MITLGLLFMFGFAFLATVLLFGALFDVFYPAYMRLQYKINLTPAVKGNDLRAIEVLSIAYLYLFIFLFLI